jgi:hypothetical protein
MFEVTYTYDDRLIKQESILSTKNRPDIFRLVIKLLSSAHPEGKLHAVQFETGGSAGAGTVCACGTELTQASNYHCLQHVLGNSHMNVSRKVRKVREDSSNKGSKMLIT